MGISVVVLAVALTGLGIVLGMKHRMAFLRGLNAAAGEAMRRVTDGVFDRPPSAVVDERGVRLEGTHDGEAIIVRAAYTPSASPYYMRTGYEDGAGAQLTVTVGMRGATPRFGIRVDRAVAVADEMAAAGQSEVREVDFARAWKLDVDTGLAAEFFDPEVRGDLMRLVGKARSVRSITVADEGLSIEWVDDPAQAERMRPAVAPDVRAQIHQRQAETLRAAMDTALRLQNRLLAAIERSASKGGAAGAFRGG